MSEDIGAEDLVIINDAGEFFVVKMKEANGQNVPERVAVVDRPNHRKMIATLRRVGVTLAAMPEFPTGGGCTCYLINLESLSQTMRPQPMSPRGAKAIMDIAGALGAALAPRGAKRAKGQKAGKAAKAGKASKGQARKAAASAKKPPGAKRK